MKKLKKLYKKHFVLIIIFCLAASFDMVYQPVYESNTMSINTIDLSETEQSGSNENLILPDNITFDDDHFNRLSFFTLSKLKFLKSNSYININPECNYTFSFWKPPKNSGINVS